MRASEKQRESVNTGNEFSKRLPIALVMIWMIFFQQNPCCHCLLYVLSVYKTETWYGCFNLSYNSTMKTLMVIFLGIIRKEEIKKYFFPFQVC